MMMRSRTKNSSENKEQGPPLTKMFRRRRRGVFTRKLDPILLTYIRRGVDTSK